jgi:hypothetical protein
VINDEMMRTPFSQSTLVAKKFTPANTAAKRKAGLSTRRLGWLFPDNISNPSPVNDP